MKKLSFFFDKDEAGKMATEAVAALLPSGKVKIAHLPDPYKDASDALQNNDAEAIGKLYGMLRRINPMG